MSIRGNPGNWLNRIALFHAMSISQSAMYLGRYTLAIGTVESARHSAELAGEKTFSLLWLTHFCFLLLQQRQMGQKRSTIWTSCFPAPIR